MIKFGINRAIINRLLHKFIFISGLLLLSACAASSQGVEPQGPEIPFAEITFKGERATKAERELCESVGGSISRQGLAGYEMCVRPYADAGKTCQDSSECEGQCRAQDFGSTHASQITGTCQADNIPFGCYAEVKNGIASPALCVD